MAQIFSCKNVFVMDFQDEKGKRDTITRRLTDEFETRLSQYSECVILSRRDASRILMVVDNETKIHSLSDSSRIFWLMDEKILSLSDSTVKKGLKIIKAEIVVFGTITYYPKSKMYVLNVKFQNIETTQFHASNKNIPRAAMVRNIVKLQKLIDEFVCSLLKGPLCLGSCDKDIKRWLTLNHLIPESRDIAENNDVNTNINPFVIGKYYYQEYD